MNYIKRSLIIYVICFASLIGSSSFAKYEEAPRISAAEAYKIFKTGDAVFVDANPLEAYDRKHILGSVNIPNDGPKDIEALRNLELPFTKDKKLIIYCL